MTPSLLAAARLNFHTLRTTEPPVLDFIWPGFLSGTVGALFAPGATSKSFFALQAAVGVASGADILGLGVEHLGRVVYLSLEDPLPILHHRVRVISKKLTEEQAVRADDAIDILDVVGRGLDLQRDITGLVEYCADARLIMVDTISRTHRLDENKAGDMSALVGSMESLVRQTGAALLFLHHVSKASAREGVGDQHAARGSSVLTDNARCAISMTTMTPGESQAITDRARKTGAIGYASRTRYVRMSIPKNNYSAPIADRWFRRGADGVLEPVNLLDREDKEAIEEYTRASQKSQMSVWNEQSNEGWTSERPF